MLDKLKNNVEWVLLHDRCVTTAYLDSRRTELQEELVKAVGDQDRIGKIAEEIDDLRAKRSTLLLKSAKRDALMDRIEEQHLAAMWGLLSFIKNIQGDMSKDCIRKANSL